MKIPDALRRFVVHRAKERCEYCGLSQIGQEAQFHIDHIVPTSADGETKDENLALACVSCSLRKGGRQWLADPLSGAKVPVFHLRQQEWAAHFQWNETILRGKTDIGRAMVEALQMNRPVIVAIRQEEAYRGRHPA